MSKGGAGKVYFVLYLAVILELLIIIVERDEAEEHLVKKQKESMKIVESILSQLQAGAGTEGIGTRPQDEITLKTGDLDPEVARLIDDDREYLVDVGVVDVSGEVEKVKSDARMEPKDRTTRFKELVDLANVKDLQYQIYYNSSQDAVMPLFPSEDTIVAMEKKSPFKETRELEGGWKLEMVRQVVLDEKATKEKSEVPEDERYKSPVYKSYSQDFMVGNIQEYSPAGVPLDSIFRYSQGKTDTLAMLNGHKYKKRTFAVMYKPPQRPGWFKLRFTSRTNRILGIRSPEGVNVREIGDEEKVNIGTVQLKVKDLRLVKKELLRDLETMGVPSADDLAEGKMSLDDFTTKLQEASAAAQRNPDEKIREKAGKMELYSYIAQLLAPNQSENFDKNKGSMVFSLRVVKLPPQKQPPAVVVISDEDTRIFDKLQKTVIRFEAGPYQPTKLPTVSSTPPLPWKVVDLGVSGGATASGAGGANEAGKTRKYQIVLEQPAPAGEYTITVSHSNERGMSDTKECKMKVYESRITNEDDIKSNLAGFQYGDKFIPTPIEPASGNSIKPGEFILSGVLGTGDQLPDSRGFTIPESSGKCISANAQNLSFRVAWEFPRTGEKVVLLDAEGKPSQKKAKVTNVGTTDPGFDRKNPISRQVGIRFSKPPIDCDAIASTKEIKASGKINAKQTSLPTGYSAGSPEVSVDGDGYAITVPVQGPAIRVGRFDGGTIVVTLTLKVTNPVNGEVTESSRDISINVPSQ